LRSRSTTPPAFLPRPSSVTTAANRLHIIFERYCIAEDVKTVRSAAAATDSAKLAGACLPPQEVKMNHPFTEKTKNLFDIYADFLLSENEKINLTAIKNRDEIFIKHFEDSVRTLDFADLPAGASVIDVGSGAGFPGVPIKIVRPDIKLTCIDSTGKKVAFLSSLSKELGIPFDAIAIRAEEAGHSEIFREKYDAVLSRAVAALPVLSELCLPLAKNGGIFVSLKGESESAETSENAFTKLGGKLIKSEKYNLSNGDGRQIFIVEKMSNTPSKYPRSFGVIKKSPL
jgi:16S rRNA (guanine527-N7)-methyltransferase